jgi:phosphomannomutase / phosphoglucomutase
MNPDIFREYDIRGIAGTDMTEPEVIRIGAAVGTYLRRRDRKRIVVGRDCRVTSPAYAERVMEGLLGTGCDVIDIGICPTPVFYFAIHHLSADGGVMVTASHNPPDYNGFKLCIGLDSIHGSEIRKIREMIEAEDFPTGHGERSEADVIGDYIDYVAGVISIPRPLRVGVDAGNGTAGVVAVPLLKRLGCEVVDIYCEMDGTFPNHEADPTVRQNMEDLIGLVRREGLDLGIGYDGDGDRIGVVDEAGRIVYGDRLMILLAREILERKPGATFIAEVKCSQTLYDDIAKRGGRAIMWKTGHSLIKEKMKAEGAALAGEMSGHLFFADRYLGYDDAIYATGRVLEILARSAGPLSALLADVPETVTTPEIRVDCPDREKAEVVRRVADRLAGKYDVIDIDGVRVRFDDGWGLVRASNTQPALVLRFEAASEERLAEIREFLEGEVAAAGAEMEQER